MARLGYIIRVREKSNRQKFRNNPDLYDAGGASAGGGGSSFDVEKTSSKEKKRPSGGVGNPYVGASSIATTTASGAFASVSSSVQKNDLYSSRGLEMLPADTGCLRRNASADKVSLVKGMSRSHHGPREGHVVAALDRNQERRDITPRTHLSNPGTRVISRERSWHVAPGTSASVADVGDVTLQHRSGAARMYSSNRKVVRVASSRAFEELSSSQGRKNSNRNRTSPEVQPAVSPVNHASGSPSEADPPRRRTPRASAGFAVATQGSLWDRAESSPMHKAPTRPRVATATRDPNISERDNYENALLRAVEEKWTSSRGGGGGQGELSMTEHHISSTAIPKSMSLSDAPRNSGRKNAMLMAGKCWTCVCQFENSAGQSACLSCGRIAPARKSRTDGTPLRQNSLVPPKQTEGRDLT